MGGDAPPPPVCNSAEHYGADQVSRTFRGKKTLFAQCVSGGGTAGREKGFGTALCIVRQRAASLAALQQWNLAAVHHRIVIATEHAGELSASIYVYISRRIATRC